MTFTGESYAVADLIFAEEVKPYDADSWDHARGLADEKGVLFFSYKPIGFFESRHYMRDGLLGEWRQVEWAQFHAAVRKHRGLS